LARRTVCRLEGGGLRGLQLLATTVSSSSSSSVRMLKELLWRVWRSCTSGMFLMPFGAVILFDVVATLRGGAFATFGLVAATLGAGVPVRTLRACVPVRIVGSSGVCRPAKMALKSCIAMICLIFFRGHCRNRHTKCHDEFCCHRNGKDHDVKLQGFGCELDTDATCR
jgi:hypothetical protein